MLYSRRFDSDLFTTHLPSSYFSVLVFMSIFCVLSFRFGSSWSVAVNLQLKYKSIDFSMAVSAERCWLLIFGTTPKYQGTQSRDSSSIDQPLKHWLAFVCASCRVWRDKNTEVLMLKAVLPCIHGDNWPFNWTGFSSPCIWGALDVSRASLKYSESLQY